jgi:hypothetical protein
VLALNLTGHGTGTVAAKAAATQHAKQSMQIPRVADAGGAAPDRYSRAWDAAWLAAISGANI